MESDGFTTLLSELRDTGRGFQYRKFTVRDSGGTGICTTQHRHRITEKKRETFEFKKEVLSQIRSRGIFVNTRTEHIYGEWTVYLQERRRGHYGIYVNITSLLWCNDPFSNKRMGCFNDRRGAIP